MSVVNIIRSSTAFGVAVALSLFTFLVVHLISTASAQENAPAQAPPAPSAPPSASASSASEMDEVAAALKGTGEIKRVRESVVLNVPDENLFDPKQLETLSAAGNARLGKIAETLRAHPDNHIYIEEYVPPGQPRLKTTRRALAQADLIRIELINQAISANRLTIALDATVATQQGSPAKATWRHRFTLRIVPESK